MQKQLSASLNARQLAALQSGAPTASDILDNVEFMDELNEEIGATYTPPAEIKTMGATMPVERPVRKLPQPSLKALDPEAELDEMNRQAEVKIAKRREELEKAREAELEQAPVQEQLNPEEALHSQII